MSDTLTQTQCMNAARFIKESCMDAITRTVPPLDFSRQPQAKLAPAAQVREKPTEKKADPESSKEVAQSEIREKDKEIKTLNVEA